MQKPRQFDLCRLFNNLEEGMLYGEVMPAYHIGILDFWLPDKTKEFYSEYRLMNVKNHEIYSSKFGINVLNLRAVEDATIVKEPADLYEWAKLFKATTWEELKMLAEKNEYMAGTVYTLAQLSEDDKIRMQCEARERYERDKASYIGQTRENTKQEDIIELLEDKGDIPDELNKDIHRMRNIDTLKKWHKLAAKVDSVEEFITKMKNI